MSNKDFNTKAIHVGQKPDETTGAIIPPVYLTSTYVQEYPGVTKGYDYTRAGNPNFTRLEAQMAALEHAKHATVFASGLSSITALCHTLKPGDKVLATNDLYGGTYRLFKRVYEGYGIELFTVDTQDLDLVKDQMEAHRPKFLFVETPTNPLLNVADIQALSDLAHQYDCLCIVDNTFASPFNQNPILHGADVVMHSSTKYIGGHSDLIGGVLMYNEDELKPILEFNRMAVGLNPSPFDAWMVSRSLKTLGVRMERHNDNALKVAQWLEQQSFVKHVYYPGLPSHPNHEIAKKQMHGFSGIVSVEFDWDLEKAKSFVSSLSIFALAESLGGIESLVDHPATMTHASIPAEERAKAGLSDGLMRFSVGIEYIEDLINDLDSAAQKIVNLERKHSVVPGMEMV